MKVIANPLAESGLQFINADGAIGPAGPVGNIYTLAFTNADLTGVGSDTLTVTHNLGSKYVVVELYGYADILADLNTQTDASVIVNDENTLTLTIVAGNLPLTGTWHISCALGGPQGPTGSGGGGSSWLMVQVFG